MRHYDLTRQLRSSSAFKITSSSRWNEKVCRGKANRDSTFFKLELLLRIRKTKSSGTILEVKSPNRLNLTQTCHDSQVNLHERKM